jgi:ectoine hydroxylase-related dioxygenase (phytanoyl-CoA dioxygenase family)
MATRILSDAQVKEYHKDGFLVVSDVLTGKEVDEFVAYESEPKPGGWRESLMHHKEDAHWKQIATHPNIVAIAAQLTEANPRIVQTMYLEKAPAGDDEKGGTGTALHQDLHYLPCEPTTLMACWVAMSDTDAENGGLAVVPGSHVGELRATHRTENVDDHDSWEIVYDMVDPDGSAWKQKMFSFEIDDLDHDSVVRLEVPKGAAVFFTGKTIHGSYGNRSRDRYRRAFAVHFVADGTWVYRADVHDTMATT